MKGFTLAIFWRVALIVSASTVAAYFFVKNWYILAFLAAIVTFSFSNFLYKFVTSSNRKLSRLFESIQFEDFAITFRADNHLGDSFTALNQSLNTVVQSFNQIRAEREANMQFIQAIVQQLSVGVLVFDTTGNIELCNAAALRIIGSYRLQHLDSLKEQAPALYEQIKNLSPGLTTLISHRQQDLSIHISLISLRTRKLLLVSLQNIHNELQMKELEAWQNLTKVLRHEIMNSVTPILSLAETMQLIVDEEAQQHKTEGMADLQQATAAIIARSQGIVNFVNAYREFSGLPKPQLKAIGIHDLLHTIEPILLNILKNSNIKLSLTITGEFSILVDRQQIEQVLLNLVKNAQEALSTIPNAEIKVWAGLKENSKQILVADNGNGIKNEHLADIFVPFFTTKASGNGIGLSLSRQIIQMHGGTLSLLSSTYYGSQFLIILP
jgi:two-component system, NtrC family, nitrogen regulation sensor histidine kinase NtrY